MKGKTTFVILPFDRNSFHFYNYSHFLGTQTVSIPAERYNEIVNLIIRHMRQQQLFSATGITQGDLINWLIMNSSVPAESDEVHC